jgi:hypothetical protein
VAETAQPTLLHGNTLEVAGFGVEMGDEAVDCWEVAAPAGGDGDAG